MHSRPRRPAHYFLCLLGSAALASILPAADSAADLADRLRALESRLTAVEQENAALRRELGHSPTSAARPAGDAISSATALRVFGDSRVRWSSITYAAPEAAERDQFFYQFHAGFVATLGDHLEAGFRLSAGDPSPTFGGSPLTAQFFANDNASRKAVFLDQAFLRWKTAFTSGARATVTLGKSDNLFHTPTRLLFDNDYHPEGATEELILPLGSHHRLTLAAGQSMLDDLPATARDPWMFAERARWEAQWTPAWSTTLGLTSLRLTHASALTAANIANNGRGNTRTPAGVLVYGYRPFYAEASVTHLLDHAPGYPGRFPVTVLSELIHNPAAPAQRDGATLGLTLGRALKAGQWELSYRHLRLEADAWFEEMAEGDYSGYYRAVPPGWNTDPTSVAGGPGNGTNYRSHFFRASYAPADYLLLSANLYFNQLVRPPVPSTDTGLRRLQVESQVRF